MGQVYFDKFPSRGITDSRENSDTIHVYSSEINISEIMERDSLNFNTLSRKKSASVLTMPMQPL